MPELSVVICTYGRPESYQACLESLRRQTQLKVQVVTIRDRGPLARLRNKGLAEATAPLVAFIDDDVVLGQTWVSGVLKVFQKNAQIVGASGPAIITPNYRLHRDRFKYPFLSKLHDWLFVCHPEVPGHLTHGGTYTPAAASEDCTYEGPVDYLEACNMVFRTAALRAVGGFDEAYGGIGDWSEPDAAFRVRGTTKGLLWFSPALSVFHQPSPGGATLFRWQDGHHRVANADLFQRRWVPQTWRSRGFRLFYRTYYLLKWLSRR